MWDYFISHASEDKALVVAPFAHYLVSTGFHVWYDDFALNVGDSLLVSIGQGLRDSRFGVVFLSPQYLGKAWPRRELTELLSLEEQGARRILPVRHHLSVAELASISPALADRKAADTHNGLQFVAEEVVRASFPERVAGLPLNSAANTDNASLRRARDVFKSLLETRPDVGDLFLYLSAYPGLLEGICAYAPELIPGFKLPGPLRIDFAELVPHGVTGPVEVLFIVLGPSEYDRAYVEQFLHDVRLTLGDARVLKRHPANDYLGSPYFGEYDMLRPLSERIRVLVQSSNCHWEYPETWSFRFTLVIGRRTDMPPSERMPVGRNDAVHKLRVDLASYDRLLDDRASTYGSHETRSA